MAQLPEHLKGRTIRFVGPEDDYDDEDDGEQKQSSENEEEQVDPEYDQMVVPKVENKRAQLLEKDAEDDD